MPTDTFLSLVLGKADAKVVNISEIKEGKNKKIKITTNKL